MDEKLLNRQIINIAKLPPRILQFGGGNFLRGFVDYFVDIYNDTCDKELGVVVVKVTPNGNYEDWRSQDGLYYVSTKGVEGGKTLEDYRLIKCISTILSAYGEWEDYLKSATQPALNIIISNTTESGLRLAEGEELEDAPPASFPAKLTKWLWHRYLHFQGAPEAGCLIIPCELLIENGKLLKKLILQTAQNWALDPDFMEWLELYNHFCDTLVDRIIPGVPQEKKPEYWKQLGYTDHMITEGEPYHIWVVKGGKELKQRFPIDDSGLNIVFTEDLEPYRKRKVRILNGAHTALVPVALLMGVKTVYEAMSTDMTRKFLVAFLEREVLPGMDMPMDELMAYKNDIVDRFDNPFVVHFLQTISLNTFSKIKVRLLPTLEAWYQEHHRPPVLLSLSLACWIYFYRGYYDSFSFKLKDEPVVINKMQECWEQYGTAADYAEIVYDFLSWETFWGQDLTRYSGLHQSITQNMKDIAEHGLSQVLETRLQAENE